MGQLILCNAEGHELVRQEMAAAERYAIYLAFIEPASLDHAGRRYRLLSVTWRDTDDMCICSVVDEGAVPVVYCDD